MNGRGSPAYLLLPPAARVEGSLTPSREYTDDGKYVASGPEVHYGASW